MSRRVQRDVIFRFVTDKPVKQLQVGDRIWVKDLSARITSVFVVQGKKVFETDVLGLIFADEVKFKQDLSIAMK